jgi:hypothetical protein
MLALRIAAIGTLTMTAKLRLIPRDQRTSRRRSSMLSAAARGAVMPVPVVLPVG